MNQKNILILIITIVTISVSFLYFFKKDNNVNNNSEGVMCTMDAKMCPDGSYVGRTGPKCEFQACPGDKTPITLKAKLGQKVSGLDVTLTPIEVKEDSRCPTDFQCIQAGTVKVLTKIESGMGTSEMVIELGKTITTEAENIKFVEVTPIQTSGKAISASSYQFVFEVSKR